MLQKIYEQQKFTDITIILDDGQIKAHKCVLAAANIEYFDKIFNSLNEWKESSEDVLVIKECPKDTFMVLIKVIYGFNLYKKDININITKSKLSHVVSFDPQLLADLLIVGDRFGSTICIDTALNIVKNQITKNAYSWLGYILKIFSKFSPKYDTMLKNNLKYKVKTLTFSIKDDTKYIIDPYICRILYKLKVKYVLYLATLDSNHDIVLSMIEGLLDRYDKSSKDHYNCIHSLSILIKGIMIPSKIILKLVENGFDLSN